MVVKFLVGFVVFFGVVYDFYCIFGFEVFWWVVFVDDEVFLGREFLVVSFVKVGFFGDF